MNAAVETREVNRLQSSDLNELALQDAELLHDDFLLKLARDSLISKLKSNPTGVFVCRKIDRFVAPQLPALEDLVGPVRPLTDLHVLTFEPDTGALQAESLPLKVHRSHPPLQHMLIFKLLRADMLPATVYAAHATGTTTARTLPLSTSAITVHEVLAVHSGNRWPKLDSHSSFAAQV